MLIEAGIPPGSTAYVVIHNLDTGQVWNVETMAWEDFDNSHWEKYAVMLQQQGSSRYYSAEHPCADLSVMMSEMIFTQVGVAPAISDPSPQAVMSRAQGGPIGSIRGSVLAAENLRTNLLTMARGAAAAGTLSTTQMTTDLADTSDGVYVGRLIIWTSGALLRRVAYISGYAGETKKLTFGAMPAAPSEGDTFLVI
ncbi:MAG: hypothetical protein NTY77_05705 [Elusimicrobia bacterium]|nr:hypothetical protein [Elusimicrobiota bacterium]